MAAVTDAADYDAGQTSENVPSPQFDAVVYDNYYGRRLPKRPTGTTVSEAQSLKPTSEQDRTAPTSKIESKLNKERPIPIGKSAPNTTGRQHVQISCFHTISHDHTYRELNNTEVALLKAGRMPTKTAVFQSFYDCKEKLGFEESLVS
ncbi:unnamed protein product [Protopolystoma xenopodis]|uniref:Uncharacterized protein n=1 Tax=Protopolystoma xenopodis TaxID=117903 RepID=A0A3S5BA31_9PLAT|nr:unnamed protein product [Protopolystoma xenopodis]